MTMAMTNAYLAIILESRSKTDEKIFLKCQPELSKTEIRLKITIIDFVKRFYK